MRALPLLGIMLLCVLTAGHAAAQDPQVVPGPQFVPAYPLYCQGPLTTSPPSGGQTTTPFVWAPTGAGAANPGGGQCVWADRTARGTEIQPGGGNVICDFSGAMQSVPAGTYIEVGVARDPLVGHCMHLSRYIGTVSPPFLAVPALPPFVRQSIASLTNTQIASLRHGFQVMMSRPASDPTSYGFQANIHGTFDTATTPQEIQSWNNCEHGTYYFLSWHRMYLYFFDRILRAASGDSSLVLPYWNWTDPAQRTLPVAFRDPASASNPLYLAPPARPAELDAGTASLGPGIVDFSAAFADMAFDSPSGSGASFGGQVASPMHQTGPHSAIEQQPHDVIHVALGGLMRNPNTASKDPIFWLHHANIDRLWSRWLALGGGRTNPTDAAWLNTQFTFYDEAGHAVYLTGAEIVDTIGQLNYRYDDDSLLGRRLFRRSPVTRDFTETPPLAAAGSIASAVPREEMATSAPSTDSHRIELAGTTARVHVPLNVNTSSRLRALGEKNAPHQVLLRLDDIRYDTSSGVYYEVYVSPAVGEKLDIDSPHYIGNLSLFGLKPHAKPEQPAPSTKNIYVEYDISHLMLETMAGNPKELRIVLVPRGLFDARGEPLPVPMEVQGTVGQVRILGH